MKFKVPYIDLPKQYANMETDLSSAIKAVFSSGSFILRDDVKKFEKNMANYLGCRCIIGLNSGTDSLFLAIHAQRFEPASEIITVSHTFIATIAAIKHCGLEPVLVDIGEDYNMDVNRIEEAVTNRTCGIIPVHLNGRACEMSKIMEIAKRHDLVVIEDSCQALGASYKGKKTGTFGIGCFSLHPIKTVGAPGDGGFLATDDESFAEKIRLLRDHGQKTKDEIEAFGFNSRLDNLHAAVLNIKYKYLKKWIEKRRTIASKYHQGLFSISELRLPPPPSDGEFYDVYSSYCICAERRDDLVEHLARKGIEVFVHWRKPVHLQKALGLGKFNLPRTEYVSKTVLSLPIYPEMEDSAVDVVIAAIKKFYHKK